MVFKKPSVVLCFWGNGRIFEQVKQKPPCEILLAAAVVIGPFPLCKQIFSGGGSSWAGRRPVSAGHPPNSQTGLTLQQWDCRTTEGWLFLSLSPSVLSSSKEKGADDDDSEPLLRPLGSLFTQGATFDNLAKGQI